MVIGWICSRDLFETSWEGLHEVLPIVIAEESRMFTCVLSLPQWRCYRNFELRCVAYERTRRMREIMASFSEAVFGWDDSHYYAHTEAKYTGIMPVLLLLRATLHEVECSSTFRNRRCTLYQHPCSNLQCNFSWPWLRARAYFFVNPIDRRPRFASREFPQASRYKS